jgi:hypothetical protein
MSNQTKKIGEEIIVNENEILGTPRVTATIKEVTKYGYVVNIDGDDWDGQIDFEGNVLQDYPFFPTINSCKN